MYGRICCAPNAQLRPTLKRPRMLNRHVERVERLAGERASAAIGDRGRDHQRHVGPAGLELVVDAGDGGLRVQGIEHRLEEQEIDPSVHEAAHLFPVRLPNARECRGAERRVVDVRRDRQRPIGRSDRAGDEPRTRRRLAGSRRRRLHVRAVRPRHSARRRWLSSPKSACAMDVLPNVLVSMMSAPASR